MNLTKDDLASYYEKGGGKTVAWVKIAEDALNPESDCPVEIRELFYSAAESNLRGDVDGLVNFAVRLNFVFESVFGGENTPAGRLSGILTAVDVFGAVQAAVGNIEPER